MSTEMDMDGPSIKSGMPTFSKKMSAPQKSANEELDPNNVFVKHLELVRSPELKERKEKSESIFGATKTHKHMEAGLEVGSEGINANVGVSMSKSSEVSFGTSTEISKEQVLAEAKKDPSGKVPLDAVSKAILKQLGYKPEDIEKLDAMDAEKRDEEIRRIFERVQVALREEKGMKASAGVYIGDREAQQEANAVNNTVAGQALALGGGVLAAGLGALGRGTGALLGKTAGLIGETANLMGETAGMLGRGVGSGAAALRNTFKGEKSFEGVAVLPKISEYRLKKVEEAAENYSHAVDKFWKVPAMAAMRHEIKERARQTGLSVPDAMEKIKPGGEWQDLHQKFVDQVSASPEAIQSKVAMDKALSSWIRQYDHGSEELLSVDVDADPSHQKAKERFEASKELMQSKSAETPVFGGEEESHAQRLKEAIEAIAKRIREILEAVRQKVFGGEVEHASP